MHNTILQSERLLLRPITEEDTPQIVKWRNTKEIRQNFLYQKPFTGEEHRTWLKKKVEPGQVEQFIICEKRDDGLSELGSVYLRDVDYEKKEAEYGIFIGEPEGRGHGIGSEACRMLCDYAKDGLLLKRLTLRLFEENIAAYESYRNVGFMQIPNREQTVFSEVEQKEKKVIFMERYL